MAAQALPDWATEQVPSGSTSHAPAAATVPQLPDWATDKGPTATQIAAMRKSDGEPGFFSKAISDATQVMSKMNPVWYLPKTPTYSPDQVYSALTRGAPAALTGAANEAWQLASPLAHTLLPANYMAKQDAERQAQVQAAQQLSPEGFSTGTNAAKLAEGTAGATLGATAAAPIIAATGLSGIPAAMLSGAASGAAGFGLPNPSQGQTRLGNTARGAAFGAGLGLAAPLAVKVGGAIASPIVKMVKGISGAGRREELGDKLLQLAGGKVPDINAPPIPGLNQTLGSATKNPDIQYLERSAFRTPAGKIAYDNIRDANNIVMSNAAKLVSPGVNPEAIPALSSNLDNSFSQAKQAADANEDKLWEMIDPTGRVAIPKTDLASTLNTAKNAMGPVKASAVPAAFDNMVSQLPENIPLMHYKDLHTYSQNLASSAFHAGDKNAGVAMSNIAKALQQHAGEVPMRTIAGRFLSPEEADATAQRFADARNYSKLLFNTFGKNPLASLFKTDATGAASVEPEAIVKKLFNPSKPSGIDLANQALDIGGQKQGSENMATAFVSKIINDASKNNAADSQGNRYISGSSLARSLRDNQSLIPKVIKNKTARYLLGQIGKAAESNDMLQTPGGTGEVPRPVNVNTHKLIDEIMGTTDMPNPRQAALGAAAASQVIPGMRGIGGAIAPYADTYIATSGAKNVLSKSALKMQQLLIDALTNPSEGMKLLQEANARNAAKLSPAFKKYFTAPSILYGAAGANQS